MPTVEEILSKVKQQEKDLQFSEFTSDTALSIGLAIIERAKKENLQVAVDIIVNGHQLFHFAFQGTSPFNDQMIIRKNRIANRYSTSFLPKQTDAAKYKPNACRHRPKSVGIFV